MNYRKTAVALVTFLGGLYFFLEFVLPAEVAGVKVDRYHEQITLGFITVGSMAVGLGLINLLMLHGSKIIFRRRGALDSVALLAGLAGMMSVTIVDWQSNEANSGRVKQIFVLRDFARKIHADSRSPDDARARAAKLDAALQDMLAGLDRVLNEERGGAALDGIQERKLSAARRDMDLARSECGAILKGAAERGSGAQGEHQDLLILAEVLNRLGMRYGDWLNVRYESSLAKRIYRLLYDGLFVPLGSAMFSLLAFYMAAAAYRAFRVRSAESALMMAAAVIVMLGQIPFGIWIWSEFPELRFWLLTVPNSAAFRGIALGAAVAGLVMAFRMWLSIESDSFAEER